MGATLAALGGLFAVLTATSATGAGAHPRPVPAADGTCRNPGTAAPMVFVHGLDGSPSSFISHGDPSLASTLSALPGVSASYFDYQAYASEWVTDPHIGPALARDIACLADTSTANGGPGKVIVVTHSMGGLALRDAAAQTVAGRSVAARIGLAVTVAAPNTGSWIDGVVHTATVAATPKQSATAQSVTAGILDAVRTACDAPNGTSGPAADLLSVCGLVLAPDTPGGQAMVPGSKQLAALAPLPLSVPLYAVAGDTDLTTTLDPGGLGPLPPVTVAVPVAVGDLLVKPDSALAEANHPGPYSGSYTDTCTVNLNRLTDATTLATVGWGGCTHGGLLYASPVTAAVTGDVTRYLTS